MGNETIQPPIFTDVSKADDPEHLFNLIKQQVDLANDQALLNMLREALILKLQKEDDTRMLVAVEACNRYIEKKYDDLPEKNYRYCNELVAHGLFCFIGSIIIILALLNILTPSIILFGPAFVIIGLSVGFTFKNAIQYLGSPGIFKQPTEFTKLILSATVTAEIAFYNLSEVTEVSLQATDISGIITLSLGLLTLTLSLYVLYLAYKTRKEISTYQAYKNYFQTVIAQSEKELDKDNEQNAFLQKEFMGTQELIEKLADNDANKIVLYLKGIVGEQIDHKPGKPSKELSDHCLEQIKNLLKTKDTDAFVDDNAEKLYQLIALYTKQHQIEQPSLNKMPFRITADAGLILSSIGMHLLIGLSITSAAFIWPIFVIGLISLIIFTYNEFSDFKRKHFFLGISATYIAFFMMLIIFTGIIGFIAFNPLFFGFGIIAVLGLAYGYKKFVLEPNQNKFVTDLEHEIKSKLAAEPTEKNIADNVTITKDSTSTLKQAQNKTNRKKTLHRKMDTQTGPHPDDTETLAIPAQSLSHKEFNPESESDDSSDEATTLDTTSDNEEIIVDVKKKASRKQPISDDSELPASKRRKTEHTVKDEDDDEGEGDFDGETDSDSDHSGKKPT